jgi:hypothetical protein
MALKHLFNERLPEFLKTKMERQSRTRKFEQDAKWSSCLKAAMIAANRRDHEQTTAPEPHSGLQGEGGACRRQELGSSALNFQVRRSNWPAVDRMKYPIPISIH